MERRSGDPDLWNRDRGNVASGHPSLSDRSELSLSNGKGFTGYLHLEVTENWETCQPRHVGIICIGQPHRVPPTGVSHLNGSCVLRIPHIESTIYHILNLLHVYK